MLKCDISLINMFCFLLLNEGMPSLCMLHLRCWVWWCDHLGNNLQERPNCFQLDSQRIRMQQHWKHFARHMPRCTSRLIRHRSCPRIPFVGSNFASRQRTSSQLFAIPSCRWCLLDLVCRSVFQDGFSYHVGTNQIDSVLMRPRRRCFDWKTGHEIALFIFAGTTAHKQAGWIFLRRNQSWWSFVSVLTRGQRIGVKKLPVTFLQTRLRV